MTNEEAIAYGKRVIDLGLNDETQAFCELAIKALETIPKYKDAYNKGWDDGTKATYEHLKMCEEEQESKYCDRNICISNEYNGIGCDECEVTKSQEPKEGHWIATENGFECSECGCISRSRADICQYCSTRMVGEKE